jgi:hypothetical protein
MVIVWARPLVAPDRFGFRAEEPVKRTGTAALNEPVLRPEVSVA